MSVESLLIQVCIGAVAGTLADLLVGDFRVSLLNAVVIGILGMFFGTWLFGMLNIPIGVGILWQLLVAFVGAVVLLVLIRMVRKTVY